MPSPFPGMDPFIEGQRWEDFHHEVISGIRAALIPAVRPRYVVEVQERVYVERPNEVPAGFITPDASVVEPRRGPEGCSGAIGLATAVEVATVTCTLPMPERRHEYFLVLRERASGTVVTVIEVLSPSNKRRGSDGRREYLNKRDTVLLSPAHLVELDLLRGGGRLPTIEPLPAADYYVFVSPEHRRPKTDVYCRSLRDRLPTIPVPLAGEDAEVSLDLQAVFTSVYDRAGYDYSLDYRRPVEPPLSEADATWVREVLAEAERR
jgi:Protein of unknown function (DUF4058)